MTSTRTDHPLGVGEGAAFMATGAALVVHILADVPLWLSCAAALAGAVAVLVVASRRHPAGVEAGRKVVAIGAVSAAVALVAYDATRLAVAVAFDYEVHPFEAFRHFGAGLIGPDAPEGAQWVAGTAFHVTNAITFGIAYTVWAGRRGVAAGIAFGLALEAAMLGLYPAWLQIANLREFASMSVVGHVAYGAALGAGAKARMARARLGSWTAP